MHHFITPHSHLIHPQTILSCLILISSHLSDSSSHLHTTKLKSSETVRAASAILGLEQKVFFFVSGTDDGVERWNTETFSK